MFVFGATRIYSAKPVRTIGSSVAKASNFFLANFADLLRALCDKNVSLKPALQMLDL
jgi:hypothetical protein